MSIDSRTIPDPACTCGHPRSEHAYVVVDGPCGARSDGCQKYAERRAPVNGMRGYTIAWSEHEAAWSKYGTRYNQSAEQIAARGGFGIDELLAYLGRGPVTLQPADMQWIEQMRTAVAGRKPRDGGSPAPKSSGRP